LFLKFNKFIKAHHYSQLDLKVTVTKAISLIWEANFSYQVQLITLHLLLMLTLFTVPTVIVIINITILIPMIAIDCYIVKNINDSLCVLAGTLMVGIMKKKGWYWIL